MDYKATKRNWKSKQYEKTGYNSSIGPMEEKKSGREEFKKDLAEAIRKGTAKKKMTYGKGKKGDYDGMSVADLRKLLNQKKHNLLKKAGFPDGKLPRSKAAMIALCKRLKRKRW